MFFSLSYNTVDSYIGKLLSIFNEIGRQGDKMVPFRVGNTASGSLVKQYLKSAVTEEHARITREQATPHLVNKLVTLSHCLEKRLLSPALSLTELFIVAGDQAFFKTLCFF